MLIHKLFRSRLLVSGVLVAFVLLVTPSAPFAQGKPPVPAAGGSLVGFIYDKDMKTPVASAVVKLRDLSTAAEYASQPTDANGMYRISGLKEGRYIMGVTTAQGDFNFDYGLVIKGNETAKLSVALQAGGQTTGPDAKKKSFFTSPAGIAVIVIIAGSLLWVLLSKEEASAIK